MSEGPLHPRRLRLALQWLANEDYAANMEKDTHETCVAALRLILKGQKSLGLSENVADLGARVTEVLEIAKRFR